jgi:hypothetical protein
MRAAAAAVDIRQVALLRAQVVLVVAEQVMRLQAALVRLAQQILVVVVAAAQVVLVMVEQVVLALSFCLFPQLTTPEQQQDRQLSLQAVPTQLLNSQHLGAIQHEPLCQMP